MIVDNEIRPASKDMVAYACKNFHYAKSVPGARKLAFAIFEESTFRGVIVYSLGASPQIAQQFGLR